MQNSAKWCKKVGKFLANFEKVGKFLAKKMGSSLTLFYTFRLFIMASVKIKLDTRTAKKDGTYPVVASVSAGKGRNYRLPIGISVRPEHWEPIRGFVKNHENHTSYNMLITRTFARVNECLLMLEFEGRLNALSQGSLQAILKKVILGKEISNSPMLVESFNSYIQGLDNPSTIYLYRHTCEKIVNAFGDIPLADIDVNFLKKLERLLRQDLKINGVNQQMRNLRAVINDSINQGLLTNYTYPFRAYKIPKEPTAKRDLSIDDIRIIRDYSAEPEMRKYLDFFMLSFYLGGINTGDLCLLRPDDYYKGRIIYRRQKTKGLPISIKVEPEAQELIERYRGREYLLKYCDGGVDYHNWSHRVNKALHKFGPYILGKHGKKWRQPLYPFLSMYYARHSFATIASEDCDISLDVVGRILGHAEKTVTDIYIHRKTKKMDEALRKVLDAIK